MAIEGIKPNVISPVNRMSSEPIVSEGGETVQAKAQQVVPVAGRQTGYEPRDNQERNPNKEEQEFQNVSPEKIKSVIDDINKKIRPTRTQCEFKFHEDLNRISITVKDSETNEVIKEIPPEKTLDMIAKTLELAGLLVDEKR